MTITNIDTGTSLIEGRVFEDVAVTFSDEDTFVDGTILARKASAADSYAGVITGTGTREATISAPNGRLEVGAYALTAVSLSSGVGRWSLAAPSGKSEEYTTLAATEDLVFPALGVAVEIADTGTNYVTNDTVAFTVVAGSKMVPCALDGENGAQYPVAVLTYELTKDSAGDKAARVLVDGVVRSERLVLDGGSTVTATVRDALRAAGVSSESCAQLGNYDNPQ